MPHMVSETASSFVANTDKGLLLRINNIVWMTLSLLRRSSLRVGGVWCYGCIFIELFLPRPSASRRLYALKNDQWMCLVIQMSSQLKGSKKLRIREPRRNISVPCKDMWHSRNLILMAYPATMLPQNFSILLLEKLEWQKYALYFKGLLNSQQSVRRHSLTS